MDLKNSNLLPLNFQSIDFNLHFPAKTILSFRCNITLFSILFSSTHRLQMQFQSFFIISLPMNQKSSYVYGVSFSSRHGPWSGTYGPSWTWGTGFYPSRCCFFFSCSSCASYRSPLILNGFDGDSLLFRCLS